MNHKSLRIDRIIILILSSIIIIGLLGFGIYFLVDFLSNRNISNYNNNIIIIDDPEPVETKKDIIVSLIDYEVYVDNTDNFDFNFIIAKLRFENDEAISFDLKNLQTSEKIHLNDVTKYLNSLQEKSYKLDRFNIVRSVVSENNIYECNIFIPYTTDSYFLRLLNSLDASMIEIDLEKNINDFSSLKFETEQQIEINDSNVTVSSCSISTMMLHNGEEYQIPSTMNIYTFRINVKSLDGSLVIEDAKFVRDNTDEVIDCLSENYESIKITNCLNKPLSIGENGALFFEAAAYGDTPDYSGNLMLKFENNNDWVKVPTILE